MLWSVCGLFAYSLVWSLVAKLDIVAVAEGRLVPTTYSKIVQPSESGIVREILVKDGDAVVAGQVLVRLDPTLAGADSKSVAGEIDLRRLTLRRIDAELAGQTLALAKGEDASLFLQVQAQGNARRQSYLDSLAQESSQRERISAELRAAAEMLNKLTATAPLVQQQADAYDKLVKDGFFSPLAVQDKRREAINLQQDLKSQEGAVASLRAQLSGQDKKISNLTSQYAANCEQEWNTGAAANWIRRQLSRAIAPRSELKAPPGGIVKDFSTNPSVPLSRQARAATIVPKDEPLFI